MNFLEVENITIDTKLKITAKIIELAIQVGKERYPEREDIEDYVMRLHKNHNPCDTDKMDNYETGFNIGYRIALSELTFLMEEMLNPEHKEEFTNFLSLIQFSE